MTSVKLLKEETFSSFSSSIFASNAVTTGATSTGGGAGRMLRDNSTASWVQRMSLCAHPCGRFHDVLYLIVGGVDVWEEWLVFVEGEGSSYFGGCLQARLHVRFGNGRSWNSGRDSRKTRSPPITLWQKLKVLPKGRSQMRKVGEERQRRVLPR